MFRSCFLLSMLVLIPAIANAEGKCNGVGLNLGLTYPNSTITITNVSYTKGFLSTQCDDTSHTSPPQWNGTGTVINSMGSLNLYAHEDNGNATGIITMNVSGPNGTQTIDYSFNYVNSGVCEMSTPTVTASNNSFNYSCSRSTAGVGNCGSASNPKTGFTVTQDGGGC